MVSIALRLADGDKEEYYALFYDHIFSSNFNGFTCVVVFRVCGLFDVDFDASIPFQNTGRFH